MPVAGGFGGDSRLDGVWVNDTRLAVSVSGFFRIVQLVHSVSAPPPSHLVKSDGFTVSSVSFVLSGRTGSPPPQGLYLQISYFSTEFVPSDAASRPLDVRCCPNVIKTTL